MRASEPTHMVYDADTLYPANAEHLFCNFITYKHQMVSI